MLDIEFVFIGSIEFSLFNRVYDSGLHCLLDDVVHDGLKGIK